MRRRAAWLAVLLPAEKRQHTDTAVQSDPVKTFHHLNTASADEHKTKAFWLHLVLDNAVALLQGDVHEWIKPAQNALNNPVPIQLHWSIRNKI